MPKESITIDYVRRRLSEKGVRLTDKDVENLLATLRFISNKAIDTVTEKPS